MWLLRVAAWCPKLGVRQFSLALLLCPIRDPSGKILQRPPRVCHQGRVLGPPQSYADAHRRVQVNETPLVQVAHHISQCKKNMDTARHRVLRLCWVSTETLPESHRWGLTCHCAPRLPGQPAGDSSDTPWLGRCRCCARGSSPTPWLQPRAAMGNKAH